MDFRPVEHFLGFLVIFQKNLAKTEAKTSSTGLKPYLEFTFFQEGPSRVFTGGAVAVFSSIRVKMQHLSFFRDF